MGYNCTPYESDGGIDCLTPPRNALLRQFQTVAQWGGTHARRQKNVTSEIEVVDLLSQTKMGLK